MEDVDELTKKSISAYLKGNYCQAVKYNLRLLRHDPLNLAACNRLGKCYALLNDFVRAGKCYQKVLRIDPYNNIAKKNLLLLRHNRAAGPVKSSVAYSPTAYREETLCDFLEIPGKTQSVNLVRLTDNQKLCLLKIGQLLTMNYQQRTVRVFNQECYIGSLPDDIAKRLLFLVKRGNRYQAYVKSLYYPKLCLFLKEIYQSPQNIRFVSFLEHPQRQ